VVHSNSICLMETSLVETAYTKKGMKSQVLASARLFSEILQQFSQKVADITDITLTFQANQFTATNFSEGNTSFFLCDE
jgi:hypothetical protein